MRVSRFAVAVVAAVALVSGTSACGSGSIGSSTPLEACASIEKTDMDFTSPKQKAKFNADTTTTVKAELECVPTTGTDLRLLIKVDSTYYLTDKARATIQGGTATFKTSTSYVDRKGYASKSATLVALAANSTCTNALKTTTSFTKAPAGCMVTDDTRKVKLNSKRR